MITQKLNYWPDQIICLSFVAVSFIGISIIFFLDEGNYSFSFFISAGAMAALVLYVSVISAIPVGVYFLLSIFDIRRIIRTIIPFLLQIIPLLWLISLQLFY